MSTATLITIFTALWLTCTIVGAVILCKQELEHSEWGVNPKNSITLLDVLGNLGMSLILGIPIVMLILLSSVTVYTKKK